MYIIPRKAFQPLDAIDIIDQVFFVKSLQLPGPPPGGHLVFKGERRPWSYWRVAGWILVNPDQVAGFFGLGSNDCLVGGWIEPTQLKQRCNRQKLRKIFRKNEKLTYCELWKTPPPGHRKASFMEDLYNYIWMKLMVDVGKYIPDMERNEYP